MSVAANRATIEAARQHFNAGEIEAYITTLYAPDVIAHFLPPGMPQGHAGVRLYYAVFAAGFPDAQLIFDDIIGEGDLLAVRYHLTGTHTGEFNGIPATGKQVAFTGITTLRFENGKAVERWSHSDDVGMLQQLGVIPALGTA